MAETNLTARAIRIYEHGGPEVMRFETIEVPPPGPGEVRIIQRAIGLNFIDIYQRKGVYPHPGPFPFVPGGEAAGIVESVGPGVTGFAPGDRVGYVLGEGAYAEVRNAPADRLVHLPESITFEQAAAMLLKGMTTQYLLRRTYRVEPGTTLLFHAAAGGVGSLFGPWAKHLGAVSIGTVGSPAKVALARASGFDHVIDTSSEDFVARVREITGGKGVDVVYDSVGKDTFPASLDCLRPLGLWVTFGNSSGVVPPFAPGLLAAKGSLYMTRPTLTHYTATREDLAATAAELFFVVGSGAVPVSVQNSYALGDAGKAHGDLEGRRTTGATVLLPG